jgi:cytochrome c oxidase cbb3-type subunit IV
MDLGTFRGIVTGVLIVLFVALTIGVYSRKRKPDFDRAARAALEEDRT